jgi:aryl-alcohol dehydrogenase-like predicted oxidoreductase
MTAALRGGVNFFDNAEVYAAGKSETVMGNILQRWFAEGLCKRSDVVIATKLFLGGAMAGVKGNPNAIGLSRKHIIEGLNDSLKRLQLDYVDLLFCHRPDPQTPIEETVRAMNYLIDQGKVFYWGTSEWSAAEITQAHAAAGRLGLIGPLMEQPQYNLLHRTRFEVEYQSVYATYGMGTTIWSPLAGGFLTGKYTPGVIPEGSRLSHASNAYLKAQYDAGKAVAGLEVKTLDAVYDKVGCMGLYVTFNRAVTCCDGTRTG